MNAFHCGRLFAVCLIAAAAATAPAVARAFSAVYIFGDSLSDSGNNGLALGVPSGVPQAITGDGYIPSLPYAPSGVYSNGPVWATSFATQLGLSAAPSLASGGTNFAYGGAETSRNGALGGFPPSLTTQVGQLLARGGTLPSDALYVVAGGGNNARDALAGLGAAPSPAQIAAAATATATAFAADIGNIVDTLQAAGALNIVVWNAPNLGAAPAVRAQGAGAAGVGSFLAGTMNAFLGARLATETGVTTFDLFGLVSTVVATPAAYGLSNVTNACVACSDPSSYLFWDGIHPTAAGHQVIANAMVAVVPEPAAGWLLAAGVLGIGAFVRRGAGGVAVRDRQGRSAAV